MANVIGTLKLVVWNGLMAAVVLTPVFLAGVEVQLLLLGEYGNRSWEQTVGDLLYFYIVFAPMFTLASIVFSLVALTLPKTWSLHNSWSLRLALSILLPGVLVVVDLGLRGMFFGFFVPAISSTIAFACVARIDNVGARYE